MKTLHVSHSLYPESNGGVEIHTRYLCSNLASAEGHEVVVFSRTRPAFLESPLIKRETDGLTIYWFTPCKSTSRLKNRYFAFLNKLSALRFFIKLLHTERPDLVHIHHLLGFGRMFILATWLFRIPYVLDLADYWYICPNIKLTCGGSRRSCARHCIWERPGLLEKLVGNLRWPILKFAYGLMRVYLHRWTWRELILKTEGLMLAVSERTKFLYERNGFRNAPIFPHLWGIEPLQTQKKATSGSPLIVGYFGQVSPEKGVQVLVEAFQKLRKKGVAIKLRIHGEIKFRQSYISSVQKDLPDIEFAGPYNHQDLHPYLSIVHMIVVPSTWEEAYGLVVQEALEARVPLIAAKIGGIEERIYDGINGFLFAPHHVDELATKLEYVFQNYAHVSQTLRYDLSRLTIDQEAQQLRQIYRWAINFKREPKGICIVELLFSKELEYLKEFFQNSGGDMILGQLEEEWKCPGIQVKKAWEQSNPRTEGDILEFYRTTDAYIYDLLATHKRYERVVWKKTAIELFHAFGCKTLLDFGGGIGDDAAAFSKLGLELTLYEVPSLTAEFAKFRLQKEDCPVRVVTDLVELRDYDGIYCTEVLEHLKRPFESLKIMYNHLKTSGILILAHSFQMIDEYHTAHLPENASYAAGFSEKVSAVGFAYLRTIQIPGNQFYLFQKPGKPSSGL